MPRFSPVGDVWAGVGDNVVSLNGQEIARGGGGACALDAHRGIFQIGAELYTWDVRTGTLSRIDPDGANGLRANAGIYEATFKNILRVSDRTVTYPGYYVGDVGRDGTVLIVLPDGTFKGIALLALQSLGGDRWFGSDYGYRPAGNVPVEVPSGPLYGLRMTHDERYICYQHAGRFIVSTATGRKGLIYDNVPSAYRPDILLQPNGRLAWTYATGPAELPGEVIVQRDIDPATLTQDIRDVVDVPRIGRPMWVIWFEHATPAVPPPGHGVVPFYGDRQGIAVADGHDVFSYVDAEAEGTLAALNAAEAAAKAKRPDLPTVVYFTNQDWVPNGDWLAPQAYCRRDETPAQMATRMRAWYEKLTRLGRTLALIPQCYTSNADYTTDLPPLVPEYARLCIDFRNIIATVPFNDAGRGNSGLAGHPEARPAWSDFFAGVTGKPSWDKPMPPSITIKSYTPTSGDAPLTVTAVYERNQGSGPIDNLHWYWSKDSGSTWVDATPQGNDPSDPDHHYKFDQPGTYRIKLRANGPGGSDETAKVREVVVTQPDGGGGGGGGGGGPVETFTLRRSDRSERVGVDASGFLNQQSGGARFAVQNGGLYASGRGYVAVEPPDWKGKADRGTVGEWERIKEHHNDDGTVSYQSLESGLYMSLADDFSVRFDKPNEGFWQRLVKETGGGAPFVRIVRDGKFFSTDTGEPFHVIESTDFSLCKRLCDGEDVTAVIAQRAEIGFNAVRVWMLNASVMPEFSPRLYPQMYDRLSDLIALCGSYGIVVEVTAFTMCTGPTGLMNDEGQQRDHWDRICAVVKDRGNVLLEPYNEGDQYGGANKPTISLSKPDGVVSTRGSNGSDSEPPDHGSPWDYEIYHIIGNEWQRKTGHNAMEWADQSGHPCITNESQRFVDNDRSTDHAYDSAAGGALLCAGTCFHSQNGKASLLFSDDHGPAGDRPSELDCAKAFVAGAKSVPLEYRTGAYRHEQQRENDSIIRSYSRTLGDGRKWYVDIRR